MSDPAGLPAASSAWGAGAPGADVPGRGLVAMGDSITRGSGEAMLGLRMQSWALWLAEALELPYTCLAQDGARSGDVLAQQAPRLRGPYDIGCIYVGVNDVRAPGFALAPYVANLEQIAAAAAESCARLLLVCLPPTLGRPPAPAHAIHEVNREIARVAGAHEALTLGLQTLTGYELVQPDAVHLTARGEAHVALRACELLRTTGCTPVEDELRRALEPLDAIARLRYLLGGRRPAVVRDLRRRALEDLQRRARASAT